MFLGLFLVTSFFLFVSFIAALIVSPYDKRNGTVTLYRYGNIVFPEIESIKR